MNMSGDDHGLRPMSDENRPGGLDLDALLAESAPGVSSDSPARSAALGELMTSARSQVQPLRSRRPAGRTAVFAGAAALVLVGSGAAAAGWPWTSPWSDDVVARIMYTLPSGASCELITGGFEGSRHAIVAAEEYARSVDLTEVMDVERAYAGVQVLGADALPAEGLDDLRYKIAVTEAMYDVFSSELTGAGISIDGFSIVTEFHCAGDHT